MLHVKFGGASTNWSNSRKRLHIFTLS